MRNAILWLPRQIILSHYVLFVNFTHPCGAKAEIDRKIEAMHRRLFDTD